MGGYGWLGMGGWVGVGYEWVGRWEEGRESMEFGKGTIVRIGREVEGIGREGGREGG